MMYKAIIWDFMKRGLRFLKRAALKPLKYFKAEEHHVVFVFGARTRYWPAMGKELYQSSPLFKKTLDNCDRIICSIGGKSILPNFEDPVDEHFFDDQENLGFTIMAIQVGLFEMLKAQGIAPDEVTGLSVGEVTAVYAAGGLTLEEAFRLCQSGYSVFAKTKKEYITMFLFADMDTAAALCKDSPVAVMPIYYIGEPHILAYCHTDDVQQAIDYFASKNIKCKKAFNETYWPVHTSIIDEQQALIAEFTKDINPKPIRFNYYSPTYGSIIPRHSIIPRGYWYDMMRKPVLLYNIINLIKPHKNVVLLHIGPQFFLKSQFQSYLNHDAIFLDSMPGNIDEAAHFDNIIRQFKKLKLNKRRLPNISPEQELTSYTNSLSLSSPDMLANPYQAYAYLRQHGPVNYLPKENAWIVLDYETINTILKQPALYSSKVHQGFDSILLGADPPAHTTVRTILQPLFSPQSFEELGVYTYKTAYDILSKLAPLPQFDVVENFALPLAQNVVAHFLGLTDTEADALKIHVNGTGHMYTLKYLGELETYFKDYLVQKQQQPDGAIGSLILSFVQQGQLDFEGAVSLMKMLWVAGMTTTSMLISQAVNYLVKSPEIAAELLADESNINKFIDECLRLEAPESELRRITTEEVILGDKKIPANSLLILSIRAANRQPDIFLQPDDLLLNRSGKRHLSFGGGYHYCLGIGMARAEVKNAIKAVLEKAPNLQVVSPGEYFPSFHFRAFQSLMVSNNTAVKSNESF